MCVAEISEHPSTRVAMSARSDLNSCSDWLLGFNEFKMVASVVMLIQDGGAHGGPLLPSLLSPSPSLTPMTSFSSSPNYHIHHGALTRW